MKLSRSYTMDLFGKYLESRAYSSITVKKYQRTVRDFFYWLQEEKDSDDLRDVTGADILDFQSYATTEMKGAKKRYATSSIEGMISTLRHLFRYLYRSELILSNLFDRLQIQVHGITKERSCVDEDLMIDFLENIECRNIFDVRDKALFEMMYVTGLRVGEVSALDVTDVDHKSGKVFVRNGKGRKDRIVPLGSCALEYLNLYIQKARPRFLKMVKNKEKSSALFLTHRGNRLNVESISQALKRRFKKQGIDMKITPHMIRHSFATHMLDHGAEIKAIKDILGHASIETTTIYTHFTVKSMKKLLRMYHPRENELFEEFDPAEWEKKFSEN